MNLGAKHYKEALKLPSIKYAEAGAGMSVPTRKETRSDGTPEGGALKPELLAENRADAFSEVESRPNFGMRNGSEDFETAIIFEIYESFLDNLEPVDKPGTPEKEDSTTKNSSEQTEL